MCQVHGRWQREREGLEKALVVARAEAARTGRTSDKDRAALARALAGAEAAAEKRCAATAYEPEI